MAIISTSQVITDGARNVTMQFTGICDGGPGETNVAKVKMADLNGVPRSVKVTEISYDVVGGILQLLWNADEPVPFANLVSVNTIDYPLTNGITNGGGDSANGDILFSTLGFDAGSSYVVKMRMVKKGKL